MRWRSADLRIRIAEFRSGLFAWTGRIDADVSPGKILPIPRASVYGSYLRDVHWAFISLNAD
jgi:hypothetical protein